MFTISGMALVRFGNGVSEIRGSIAGNVFSRGRAGAIIRNRTVPINPQTQSQTDVRSLFSSIAAAWRLLTGAEKEQWKLFADQLTVTNRLGENYVPSARQTFQSCNTNLVLVNSGVGSFDPVTYVFNLANFINLPDMSTTEKPTPPTFVNGEKSFELLLTAGRITTAVTNQDFIVPNSAKGEKTRFIVEATPIVSPTSGLWNRNKFRLLGSYDASSPAPLDILANLNGVQPQSGLSAGMQGLVRMYTVNDGGLRSDVVQSTMIAA